MKKIVALLLALLMLLSASACATKTNSPEAQTSEVTAEVTEEAPPIKIPDPPKPIQAKLIRGKVEGQKYTSAYTGLNFTAPEGWEYSSDVAMAELLNMGQEMLSEEKLAETLTDTTTVFDMIATDKANGDSVTVSYENMNRICGKAVSAAEYVDILKERIDAQMQVEYSFSDEAEVTLSGQKYQRVVVTLDAEVFQMTQVYYIRVIDDVAVSIVTTFMGEKPVAEIEALFE